jgi:hypothetical protein
VDSRAGNLYIALPLFYFLQTPRPPRYTNFLPHSHIKPRSMIHSLHTKVLRTAIADFRTSGVHFQCSLTCKQPLSFRDIQIAFQMPELAPFLSYTICTQKFRSIQFDRRGLMSPWEPLLAYFEARPSTFHSHFLQSLPWIIGLACLDNFHFLVAIFCAYHLRTSFQVYGINI